MTPLLYRLLHPKSPNPSPGGSPREPDGCSRVFWIGMFLVALIFGFLFWYFEVR
ncbi:hypothetical protein CCAX7_41910 [Capsulimonas corticalis]|uniref:Uncharacterized protein n=1 Tax=Capsulimonas corticalis TaxID=2219043 RepID=A0A9N7QEC6_9BACT|nr:hypothetical protein [Capsulimonas corticalis]BDI32140.1 hypothetical protein CCAX7_41910 [Capsulimonas corticalis]